MQREKKIETLQYSKKGDANDGKIFTMCCGRARMRASTGSAPPMAGSGCKRDFTETLRGAPEINACPHRRYSRSEKMVHTVLSKIFRCRRDMVMSSWYPGPAMGGGCRTCTGAHSYSTTTHYKIFLSLASPFLLCCNVSIFFAFHFILFVVLL